MKQFEKETIQAQLNDETKALQDLEKAYKQAKKDCQSKLKALNSRTDMQNLQTIIHQRKYQEALLKQIDGVLNDLQTHTYKTANDFFQGSYQNGYIGSMYELQKQGIPLTIPVSTKKMMTAIQTNSKLSSNYYLKQGLTVQNIRTLKKQIALEATRGIASGKSWLEVADSLTVQRYFQISQSDAMRIVRTEGNRINQQGRLDAGDEAVKNGCDLLKQWDATLDSKTRPAHREADGQIVEWNEKFTVNGEKMDAPSVGGSASNVCNCRCQLLKRPRWSLDDEELEVLKQRASYYGLDKTKSFEEYKNKFLNLPVSPSGQGVVETVQDMKTRLDDLEDQKSKKESELKHLQFDEKYGEYLEKKQDFLKQGYLDVADLTEDELKKLQDLADHMDEYGDKYEELAERLSNIRKERPHSEDFETDELYDEAFDNYLRLKQKLNEDKDFYYGLFEEAQNAKFKVRKHNEFIQRYNALTGRYKTHLQLLTEIDDASKEIKRLENAIGDLMDLIKKHPDYMNVYESPITKELKKSTIEFRPVSRRKDKQLTEEEIIDLLAGGDQTRGSCASLSLAYMGQKDGIDVLDFRDGESRVFFSAKGGWRIDKIEGVVSYASDATKTECATCFELMKKNMVVGKEYNLVTGAHSSMVRLTPEGEFQYLELQSARSNGWKTLGTTKAEVSDMLKWRFGATKKSVYSKVSYLYDADSLKGNKDFERILGYINTEAGKQVKGRSGSIK